MTNKALFLTFLALLLCNSLYSQNRQRENRSTPPPIEERVDTIVKKLITGLELSENQIKSSKKVFTDFFKSMDRLRTGSSRPDRTRIDSLSKKRDRDFEALLTESQKEKYKKMKENLFPKRQRPNN